MKLYKELDFWIQVVLILNCTLYPLLIDSYFLLYSYLIVGSWQLLSAGIHWVLPKSYFPVPGRLYYLRTLLGLLIAGILSLFTKLIFIYGVLLLIVSPMLAIWYAYICYAENRVIEHKSLIHLK
ncbi:MAG: hypothetical protein ACTHMV_03140 [Chitinophagaceae bacterium]